MAGAAAINSGLCLVHDLVDTGQASDAVPSTAVNLREQRTVLDEERH